MEERRKEDSREVLTDPVETCWRGISLLMHSTSNHLFIVFIKRELQGCLKIPRSLSVSVITICNESLQCVLTVSCLWVVIMRILRNNNCHLKDNFAALTLFYFNSVLFNCYTSLSVQQQMFIVVLLMKCSDLCRFYVIHIMNACDFQTLHSNLN